MLSMRLTLFLYFVLPPSHIQWRIQKGGAHFVLEKSFIIQFFFVVTVAFLLQFRTEWIDGMHKQKE